MSLFVGNGLHTPQASLSPTEKVPTVGDQGRARMQREGKSSQETAVQLWGSSGLSPGTHPTVSQSSLQN